MCSLHGSKDVLEGFGIIGGLPISIILEPVS